MQPCYTGPAGTEGVGACVGGMAACNASGVGYGPCVGEVLPKPESCATAADDNCNGQANEGCICVPGVSSACYTGPAGTEGVGVCVGGTAICAVSGTEYGSCVGQVTPQPEDCAVAVDENCDGKTAPCAGAFQFARAFGSAADEEGSAVATDISGDVFLVGYTTGTVDFGCGPVVGGAGEGGFVVKRGPSGACLWSMRLGDGSDVNAVSTNLEGDVFVAGSFSATLDFGSGVVLQSAGQVEAFFARIDADGSAVWAHGYGTAAGATGVSVDDAGNLAGTGTFQGTIDLGGGPATSQGGTDIFLVKLDPNGNFVWSHTFGDAANQSAAAVFVDTSYDVTVTGTVSGTVDFGGGPLTSAGMGDVFVAQFDATGAHLFSALYGDAQDQEGYAVAVSYTGEIFVTGGFYGVLDLGGATYTSAGGEDAFLLALSPGGNYRWSRQAGGLNTQYATALAVDRFGNVAFGGVLVGSADFGLGVLTSAGGADVFAAKYDPMGTPLWAKDFGDASSQTLRGMAFDAGDDLWLTGILVGSADFGGGPVTSAGGEDAFLAELGP